MAKRIVTSVLVSDVEKRRFPDKHYVYVISVRWSDGTNNVIYRRYSQFFNLQTELFEKFAKESGKFNPEDRIIPFLPGKILFGRSNTRDVALRRQAPIDEYCQKLVTLPSKISECDVVNDFFEVTDEDIHPQCGNESRRLSGGAAISDPLQVDHYVAVADYEKVGSTEVSVTAGMAVDVIEKNESGWWLVSVEEEQGWVPSTYLERLDGKEDDDCIQSGVGDDTAFICTSDYTAASEDELSLDRGGCVEVLQKKLDGWWWVRYKGNDGWAPATYLEKLEPERAEQFPETEVVRPQVQIVRNLYDVTNLSIAAPATSESNETGEEPKVKTSEPAETPLVSKENDDSEIQLRTKQERCGVKRKSSASSNPRFSSQPPRRNTIMRKVPPKRPDPPKVKKEYFTLADFTDHADDGLSFSEGQQVKVIEKNTSGWWYVEIEEKIGWVPATYIEERKVPLSKLATPSGGVQNAAVVTEAMTTPAASTVTSIATAPESADNDEPKYTQSTKARKPSRQNLGAPPPPPPPPIVEEVKEKETTESKDTSNADSKISGITKMISAPFSGFPKLGFKKTEDTKSETPKADTSPRPSVSNIASALKNVLVKKTSSAPKETVEQSEAGVVVNDQDIYEEIPGDLPKYERYRAIADYEMAGESEISFSAGQEMLVIEKNDSGWWWVQCEGVEGLAPETYLEGASDDFYEEVTYTSVNPVTVHTTPGSCDSNTTKLDTDSPDNILSVAGDDFGDSVVNADQEWDPDNTPRIFPTELYDVTPKNRSYSNTSAHKQEDVTPKNRSYSSTSADKQELESKVSSSDEVASAGTRSKGEVNSEESKENVRERKPETSEEPVHNAFAEARKKLKSAHQPLLESHASKKSAAAVVSTPNLDSEKNGKPLTKTKPAFVKSEQKPVTSAKPAVVKLKPDIAAKFVQQTQRRGSAEADAEVSELTKARMKLAHVGQKDELIDHQKSDKNNQDTVLSTENGAENLESRKAKLFAQVREPDRSSASPSSTRPQTPPKPSFGVTKGRSGSSSPKTSATAKSSSPARLSEAAEALKSRSPKPVLLNKPKSKVSSLASKFSERPEEQPSTRSSPPLKPKQGNELGDILSKRRAVTDS